MPTLLSFEQATSKESSMAVLIGSNFLYILKIATNFPGLIKKRLPLLSAAFWLIEGLG
jgi:hypothetical protein